MANRVLGIEIGENLTRVVEMIDEVIRLREEVAMQIKALKGLKEMAASYGFSSHIFDIHTFI